MSQWGAIYPAVQNFKNTEQYLIKECIKNCLIVMPFNKILIIFYIFGALYGVGDRVSRVIVYQKKKYRKRLFILENLWRLYHIEKAKVIISLFVWLTHISICTYLCYTKSKRKFEVVCFWKNNSQHKLEKQTWEGTAQLHQ